MTSAADSRPSDTVATECAAKPTPVLSEASTALAAIPARATRAAVRSAEGIRFEVTATLELTATIEADARTAHRAAIRSRIHSRPPGRFPALGGPRRALFGSDCPAPPPPEAPDFESRPAVECAE